jgi:hypothetical protein
MPQHIKAGGEPQKKERKHTAICLSCSLAKDIQNPQAFYQ